MVNKEIDIECMKEANEEIQNRYCDLERSKLSDYFSVSNKFIEKELFTNIKNIKENHLKRSKEIDENYEIIFKSLNREYRGHISNFKKLSLENKNKYNNFKSLMEKEEIIFLPQIEEEIITFINKIQLIYEDIKNKEKFINDFEQKFELINEENKFIKRKIAEEKSMSLKNSQELSNTLKDKSKIDDFKTSNSNIKLGSTLQKHIEKTIENHDKLLKERDEFKEKFSILTKNFIDIKEQLSECMGEREEIEMILSSKEQAIKNLTLNLEIIQKESKTLLIENGLLSKSYEELNLKNQELTNRNINLEVKLKSSNDSKINFKNEINRIIEENEKKIENFKEENIKIKQKMSENTTLFENEKIKLENIIKQKDVDILNIQENFVSQENKYKEQIDVKEKIYSENVILIENLNYKLRIISSELEEEKSII